MSAPSLDDPLVPPKEPSERQANLARLAAHVPIRIFLAAQGFEPAVFSLRDGTQLYNRREAVDGAPWTTPAAGDHIAVRWGDDATPQIKTLSVADVQRIGISPGPKPAFHTLSGDTEPFHRFVERDGNLIGVALEKELSAWAAWAQESDLPRLSSMAERQRSNLGAGEELERLTEFATALRERGFRPLDPGHDFGHVACWMGPTTTRDSPPNGITWRLHPNGSPVYQPIDGNDLAKYGLDIQDRFPHSGFQLLANHRVVSPTLPAVARAVEASFRSLAAPQPETFLAAGISSTTAGDRTFAGLITADANGLIAMTRDHDGLASGIVRLSVDSPGRWAAQDGIPGLWLSNTSGPDPAAWPTKLVITQTPLTALAHYQLHPESGVKYVAVGGDVMTDEQKRAIEQLANREGISTDRFTTSILVTGHHRANGIRLYEQTQHFFPRPEIAGQLPNRSAGRDWNEAALNTLQPERKIDLPAYAQNRLGYRELFRAPANDTVLMVDTLSKRPQKVLFLRQPDGSWHFTNELPHDRGTAVDFARTRLQLQPEEFRADIRRFALEQELSAVRAAQPNSLPLNQCGLLPSTVSDPAFRGAVRVDNNTLVYGHHSQERGHRVVTSIERLPLGAAYLPLSAAYRGPEPEPAKLGLWLANPPPRIDKIVIADTPLSAMAYHQENPAQNVQYLATSNRALTHQQASALATYVRELRQPHVDIVVAVGRGDGGLDHARSVSRAIQSCGLEKTCHVQLHAPTVSATWPETIASHQRHLIRRLAPSPARALDRGL